MHPRPFRIAFPPRLKSAERRLLALSPYRRKRCGSMAPRRVAASNGVALSGGGIRSATFALGVFQALARHGLLREVDYLSTVSGGGYFGAFLNRLFLRDYIRSAADVEWVLDPQAPFNPPRSTTEPPSLLGQARDNVVQWLRENGRYLAPRGSGDLILGGAVLLRNWVAIHATLASLGLALCLLQLLPGVLSPGSPGWLIAPLRAFSQSVQRAMPPSLDVHWSGWLAAPLLTAWAAWMCGWAYWLHWRERITPKHPGPAVALLGWGTLLAVLAIGGAFDWWGDWTAAAITAVGAAALLVGASHKFFGHRALPAFSGIPLSLVLLVVASDLYEVTSQPYQGIALVFGVSAAGALAVWIVVQAIVHARVSATVSVDADERARHIVSTWLNACLIATGALIAVVVVDSAAATLYAHARAGTLMQWAAGLGTLVAVVGASARYLTVLIGGRPAGRRLRVPLAALAAAAASLLLFLEVVALDILAHGVYWNFQPAQLSGPAISAPLFTAATVATLLFALAIGNSFAFLNRSSHQPLHAARLTRAYLGASNDNRWQARRPRRPVITPVRGDDAELHDYWPRPGQTDKPSLYEKGAPLHVVNVTINETIDGETQLQQQDRKGVGMALGPAGLSAGIRHHVAFDTGPSPIEQPPHVRHIAATYPESGYRVFEYRAETPPRPLKFPGQPLSIGTWCSVSGAAFTTGIGFRTSIGLSLLAGLANVRLGYWWDSRVDVDGPGRREGVRRIAPIGWLLERFVPVQSFLGKELLARFPGTSGRHWYISDGGHFENMGGYELIRRRLPLVIVIDAEADREYGFEGLANLVRKARLDFGAEIRFLDATDLGFYLQNTALRPIVGPLESLRPSGGSRTSASQCAIARVRYIDEEETRSRRQSASSAPTAERWLIYIKPTLAGDEPADVLEYARKHRPFPQQPTADQFFDEAQWESYRRLGEHIGDAIFGKLVPGKGLTKRAFGLP